MFWQEEQMLGRHVNPKTGKVEWALLSTSKPGKVLQYFGSKKPSPATVAKAESRVEMFKHMKKR
jgi:hypothetical protein